MTTVKILSSILSADFRCLGAQVEEVAVGTIPCCGNEH